MKRMRSAGRRLTALPGLLAALIMACAAVLLWQVAALAYNTSCLGNADDCPASPNCVVGKGEFSFSACAAYVDGDNMGCCQYVYTYFSYLCINSSVGSCSARDEVGGESQDFTCFSSEGQCELTSST